MLHFEARKTKTLGKSSKHREITVNFDLIGVRPPYQVLYYPPPVHKSITHFKGILNLSPQLFPLQFHVKCNGFKCVCFKILDFYILRGIVKETIGDSGLGCP